VKYTPKTEKGKAKLDKIIESAIDLIYEKGFNNTSIGDITRNANVSYGSFYFYFNNKDDLLVELVRKLNRDLRHYLTESIKGLKDRVSIEKRGFEAFFEWMQKNKKLYKILIEAEANNLQVYAWHYRKIAEKYSQKLKEAMEKGEITAYDPETLSFILMGIADFIAKRYILWDGKEVPPTVIKDVEKTLERMLSAKC
jgi:AcrR family transcriptional regulator